MEQVTAVVTDAQGRQASDSATFEVADVTVLSGDYPDGFTVEMGETAVVDGLVTTPMNAVVH